MFGPLPPLHRVLLLASTLVVTIAAGAWVAHVTVLPIAASAGAAIGAAAGVLVGYTLLHDFHRRTRTSPVARRR